MTSDVIGTCKWTGRHTVLGVALLLSSCDGNRDASSTSRVQVRDSAGITIIESAAPIWPESGGWIVSSQHELELGGRDAVGPTAFGTVVNATRRSDGVIVVAEGGVNEVKFFSPTGEWLFTGGGSGDGPAEYRTISLLTTLHGDSIGVFDILRRRFVLLAPDGQVGRTVSLPYLAFGRWLWDGSTVIQKPVSAADPPDFGPAFKMTPWYWLNSNGTEGDSIAAIAADFGITDSQARNVPMFPRLSPTVAIDTTGIWTGEPTSYQFIRIGFDGKPNRILRRASVPMTLSVAQMELLEETFNSRLVGAPPELLALLPGVVIRDTLPSFRAAMLDREGNLWVQRTAEIVEPFNPEDWVAPVVPGSDDWDVFDSNRGWLGHVRMPVGLTVFEIGADYVLGTWKDELDVDHVRVHSIAKPDQ